MNDHVDPLISSALAPFAPRGEAPPYEPTNIHDMLQECERWLDGVRQSRDRDRFEKRWNTLQDEAAWLAHQSRVVLAAHKSTPPPPEPASPLVAPFAPKGEAPSIADGDLMAEITRRGWKLDSQRQAELIERDGLMCERHPGEEWPHGECAGPGMPWVIEGREAIEMFAEEAYVEGACDAQDEVEAEVREDA